MRYHLAKELPMFRISDLLWLIALAALNLTLLKYFEPVIGLSPKFAGIIGLMPLFDLFALSLYVALTRRFRVTLVRRQVHRSLVDSVATLSGAILVLGTMSCLLFPEVVLLLVDLLFSPLDRWIGVSKSSPETRGFLAGTLLVMLISGPLILLTFVLSYPYSRYRLQIMRRETA
jgi:hypothetical protein